MTKIERCPSGYAVSIVEEVLGKIRLSRCTVRKTLPRARVLAQTWAAENRHCPLQDLVK